MVICDQRSGLIRLARRTDHYTVSRIDPRSELKGEPHRMGEP